MSQPKNTSQYQGTGSSALHKEKKNIFYVQVKRSTKQHMCFYFVIVKPMPEKVVYLTLLKSCDVLLGFHSHKIQLVEIARELTYSGEGLMSKWQTRQFLKSWLDKESIVSFWTVKPWGSHINNNQGCDAPKNIHEKTKIKDSICAVSGI